MCEKLCSVSSTINDSYICCAKISWIDASSSNYTFNWSFLTVILPMKLNWKVQLSTGGHCCKPSIDVRALNGNRACSKYFVVFCCNVQQSEHKTVISTKSLKYNHGLMFIRWWTSFKNSNSDLLDQCSSLGCMYHKMVCRASHEYLRIERYTCMGSLCM